MLRYDVLEKLFVANAPREGINPLKHNIVKLNSSHCSYQLSAVRVIALSALSETHSC